MQVLRCTHEIKSSITIQQEEEFFTNKFNFIVKEEISKVLRW
jgi:hypothetical protein